MRHTFLMPLALVSAMAAVQQAYAADDFVVRDIHVNGLVRLTPANVYTMLPINSGDRVNEPMIAEAIRTLYATGLFDDIKASKKMILWFLMLLSAQLFQSLNLRVINLFLKRL